MLLIYRMVNNLSTTEILTLDTKIKLFGKQSWTLCRSTDCEVRDCTSVWNNRTHCSHDQELWLGGGARSRLSEGSQRVGKGLYPHSFFSEGLQQIVFMWRLLNHYFGLVVSWKQGKMTKCCWMMKNNGCSVSDDVD